PLWTLVLAIPAVLRLDPIVSAKVIGLLLTIVAALLAGGVARSLFGLRGAAAGRVRSLAFRLPRRGPLHGPRAGAVATHDVGQPVGYGSRALRRAERRDAARRCARVPGRAPRVRPDCAR